MAKVTDKIALYLSVGVLGYILGAYITDSYLWGLALALPLTLMIPLTAKYLPRRQGRMAYGEWVRMLLLEGKEMSDGYLHLLYPVREQMGEHAYLSTDGRYVVNALGFGKVGEEWAAGIYRRRKGSAEPMVVATMDIDRKALQILAMTTAEVKILRPKEMLRRLQKQHVVIQWSPPRRHIEWRTWLGTLSLRHAGLLAISAAGCILMSIWLPFKVYYYIFAAINAALAVGVLILKKFVKE